MKIGLVYFKKSHERTNKQTNKRVITVSLGGGNKTNKSYDVGCIIYVVILSEDVLVETRCNVTLLKCT